MNLFSRLFAPIANAFGLGGGTKRYYFYGRKRDRVDTRDHRWVPSDDLLKSLTKGVDLRSKDGPIFDQGQLGSCTANGWLGLFMFVCKQLYGDAFQGSRLMLYFDERDIEGNPNDDAGAEVRDGAKALANNGVCPESEWQYDISKFAQKPPAQCYTSAQNHKIVEYMRVSQDLKHLKACLADGFPFVFGFEVFESFETASVARTGIMPMPAAAEKVVGGHCVEGIGYIDGNGNAHFANVFQRAKYGFARLLSRLSHGLRILTGWRALPVTPPANTIICRNSWGTGWGDDGYFYMPYDFITNESYASDFWTVRKVTNVRKPA